MMNDLPNKNTYYIIPDLFLAGEYPGASTINETKVRIKQYLACGVNFYIDLTEEHELMPYEDFLRLEAEKMKFPFEYYRLPIRDLSVPDKGLMTEILDTIDNAISINKKVYVHCWGGWEEPVLLSDAFWSGMGRQEKRHLNKLLFGGKQWKKSIGIQTHRKPKNNVIIFVVGMKFKVLAVIFPINDH